MIAKHIPMKSAKKSDFSELVDYLEDAQEKNERVGEITITNCHSLETKGAILEVLNTQAINKRATTDRTYHLVVSFAPGETPPDKVLQAIERRLCDALGYGEHQRVSVVHNDTDNLHIHIAINKIHPTRYTIHEPYYPYKIMADLCEKFEGEYSLVRTNHQAQKVRSENLANDLERHAGIESLLGWIKQGCADQLLGAEDWNNFHQVLADNGLSLHLKGNGFIIANSDGLMVKASSVARDLSKPKLEARFGVFQPSQDKQQNKAIQSYQGRPISKGYDTTELYARYQSERQRLTTVKQATTQTARGHKTQLVLSAKRSAKLKREAVKLMRISRASKKILYALIGRSLLKRIQAINQDYRNAHKRIAVRCKRQAWADWLKTQAMLGNPEAVKALRAREGRDNLVSNTFQPHKDFKAKTPDTHKRYQDNITKDGTIIYRFGRFIVRDDGNQVKLSRGFDHAGVVTALALAIKKYGDLIKVSGSDEFKDQVLISAVEAGMHVRFDDPDLEIKRQQLLRGHDHEKEKNRRGRSRSGVKGIRGYNRTGRTGHELDGGRGSGNMERKPNLTGIDAEPDAVIANRLRNVSKRGLDGLARGFKMLLPDNVHHHMEQGGTKPDSQMRRSVYLQGLEASKRAAAEKYISERDGKRAKGINIPLHRLFNENDQGADAVYMGIRDIDGNHLALLNKTKSNEMLVLPIDNKAANALRNYKVGDVVTIPDNGTFVNKRGKSR
jgi:Fe-S cluster biosynthesis and repair protein YggX